MKIFFSTILINLSIFCFSQPARRDIIDYKIKSVETSFYDDSGQKQAVQKNYFYLNGDDSLEILDGVINFTFKQTFDSKGRTKSLSRLDDKRREDEIHLYNYEVDNSYTIEIIAQGAGTISLKKFNSKNDCIEEILSSTDTFYYSISKSGLVEKISQKDSGIMKDVAITDFDSLGFPLISKSLKGMPMILRYLNNKDGLPKEIRQYFIEGTNENLVKRLLFEYEFYTSGNK